MFESWIFQLISMYSLCFLVYQRVAGHYSFLIKHSFNHSTTIKGNFNGHSLSSLNGKF